ncbi:hypothetical protein [Leisingera sp.]|uniref:hypothetical protein n=1 Tax=Leisingera sp. TaxID=1879318 RepID=UPI002B272032|nr:hypothetical protein [Leisingera sp.]
MSEASQNVRIVLGPVARLLIDGQDGNRPKALDDAITGLLEQLENAQANAGGNAPLAARLAALEAAVAHQTEALQSLTHAATLEMKMTRVLIASLMSESNEEHQTILALANSSVEEFQAKSRLLGDAELERLRENEASVQTAILRDLERGGLEQELKTEAEIER